MLDLSIMQGLVELLRIEAGLTIARGNQLVKKQTYPYATYNLLLSNEEALVSNITEYSAGAEGVSITRNQYSEDTVSFLVLSKTYSEAREKAILLFNAFKKESIHDYLKNNKCSANLSLTAVQDRTIFLEADYEYRFGFDIAIKSQTAYTEEIEPINTVQLTQEIYDEAEELHSNYKEISRPGD